MALYSIEYDICLASFLLIAKYNPNKGKINMVKNIGMGTKVIAFKKFNRKPISIKTIVKAINNPNQIFIVFFCSSIDFKHKKLQISIFSKLMSPHKFNHNIFLGRYINKFFIYPTYSNTSRYSSYCSYTGTNR